MQRLVQMHCSPYEMLGESAPFSSFLSWLKSKITSLHQHLSSAVSRLFRPRTVHVCGLLGTYSIEGHSLGADDDFWMAMDFVALRQLIGAHDKQSLWLCGKPISRQRELLLGDPSLRPYGFQPHPPLKHYVKPIPHRWLVSL